MAASVAAQKEGGTTPTAVSTGRPPGRKKTTKMITEIRKRTRKTPDLSWMDLPWSEWCGRECCRGPNGGGDEEMAGPVAAQEAGRAP
jgi:hypothetical protein